MKRLSATVSFLGVFILGWIFGSLLTIAIDQHHDDRIRREMWQMAIDNGVARCEVHPATKVERFSWITVPELGSPWIIKTNVTKDPVYYGPIH